MTAEFKAVKREDLVVGKTYYDTNTKDREKMVYQGMNENGTRLFSMDAEDYERTGYVKIDGSDFIGFNKNGDEFYEEVSSKTLTEVQTEIRKENRRAYLRNRR